MSFMERVVLAFKTFFRTLKDAEGAQLYLENKQKAPISIEDHSHLRLLTLLQSEGRLVDFFKEEISGFSDAQIGSAVRKIHADCNKSLEEFVTLRPLIQEAEGSRITVPVGYDSQAIKVVGKVKGPLPYQGIVRHKGWKAQKLSLPKKIGQGDASIVFQAEVEVQ